MITLEVVEQLPELEQFDLGLLHLFLKHSSAAITINENADPSVRLDMKAYFDRLAPEDEAYYMHTQEGSDDMPAHLKSTLIGLDLSIPIRSGRLIMGTWQGIYLCEHRNFGGQREITATITGEKL